MPLLFLHRRLARARGLAACDRGLEWLRRAGVGGDEWRGQNDI